MPTVLDSLSSMIDPDVIGAFGKALGAEPEAVSRGVSTVGPLIMGSMTKLASTPAGAESLMKMLPAGTSGGLGNIGSMISSLIGGGSQNALVSSLLGPGLNAISSSLSKTLGFNVAPLINLAAPAVLGLVSKAVQSGKLDANGLASLLGRETADYKANPANQETLAVLNTALAAGDQAASVINTYGADWTNVAAAPVATLLAVSSADLDGPFDTMKEVKAAQAAVLDAAKSAPAGSVLSAAFGGGLTESALSSMRAMAKDRDRLTQVIALATAAIKQRSPSEAEAFRSAIRSIGKATAEASKEGGLFGIGGTLVSDDEKAALQRIDQALT